MMPALWQSLLLSSRPSCWHCSPETCAGKITFSGNGQPVQAWGVSALFVDAWQ